MRTGAEYLESLRDGREVWGNGERVKDVTTHPALRRCAHTIAGLYDLPHNPQGADVLTFRHPDGKPESMAYFLPRNAADLGRLRKYYEFLTMQTGGLMGRFSALITLWHAYSMDPAWVYQKYNPLWLENMRNFWAACVRNDPWVCGAFHGPSGDRSKSVSEQDDPDAYLRIVEKRSDGVVVNGYKAATLAPVANEVYVVPWAFLKEQEKDWALAFCVPANTPGIKIVCREPATAAESPFEYPLSTFFDEIDAHVIFDHVFVPQERLFCAGEPIEFTIRDGQIVDIKGGFDAMLVREHMASFRDPKAYAVSHIGWGLNHLARWDYLATGLPTIGMDGRAFYGNVLFSTGPNTELGGANDTACHLDLPMKGCALYLDDELIVKDGEVVPQDMRAPGY